MNKENVQAPLKSLIKSDIIQELLYSGIGCLFFVFFYELLPNQFWNYPYRTTFILIMTLIFLFIFILLNQIEPKKKFYKQNCKRNLILFTIYFFAMILFLFYKTNWGYNGITGDNFYRTAYVTQMASSGSPQDFIYKDLSAFYSPLYWYCLALLSRLFQIKPYKMIRIGILITCYLMPIILFESWKKIYEEKISLIISIISSVNLLDIYSPDHMLGYIFFIPFFIYFYENYPGKEFKLKDYILAGFLGSLAFCTYFLYFLIIPVYYFISLVQNFNEFKKKIKHITYITIFISLFSSWFWLPLLRDIIFIGFESHQNKYFAPEILTYPFKTTFTFNLVAISYGAGIIYIISQYRELRDIRILGNIILSIYIIFILGLVGILNNFPIMHIRFLKINYYILIIASSIFYVRFFYFLSKNDSILKKKLKLNYHQIAIYLLVLSILIRSTDRFIAYTETPAYKQAYKENVRTEKLEIFEELDYEDKVFLTNEWVVAAFIPIYLFLLPNPYYSHPSALYNQRVEFLIELSECESSKEFHKKIIKNKFGPIDYFYLDFKENFTILVFEFAVETFPEGRDYYEIEFDRYLFENEEYFEEIVINGEIIYRTKL